MMIPRRKPRTANVGILAFGHDTYWGQFEGLLNELLGYVKTFERKVQACGVKTVNLGMVDNALAAREVHTKLRAADLDLLFCDMVTYATSCTFGMWFRDLNIPVVLVALQPLRRLDYSRANTYMQLCNDNFCSVPEFAGVAVRMGKRVPATIIGVLEGDALADREIQEWCDIAMVLHDVKRARIGHFGHVLESMLDMHSDPAAFTAAFGAHVVQTEIDDLVRLERGLTDRDVEAKKQEILSCFDTPDPKSDPLTRKLTHEDLLQAARAAVALDRFIDEKNLDGLAYYYEGLANSDSRRLAANLIVGNSLLCAAGFPMCGESDLKTCLAMLILDRLNIGGSFAEFHPIDFEEDFVLVGHDGPHHINIAEGKPVLRSLTKYHGKPGSGASVEFKLKEGPVSMLGLALGCDGKFKFVIAEGESVRGPIPPTGNTNTRGFFKPDVRTFLKRWIAEGPTHHFALGLGHRAQALKRIGECLGIAAAVIDKRPEGL